MLEKRQCHQLVILTEHLTHDKIHKLLLWYITFHTKRFSLFHCH